jgi:predicted ABC-type ATPase
MGKSYVQNRASAGNVTPQLVVLAGPNGAGKSTSAARILQGAFQVAEFVNADTIAQGLSGFDPDVMGVAAGRIMLARLKQLAAVRASFAFETTLASRTFARWIAQLVADGYEFHLTFLWLPSAELAVARVAERVRTGGHGVPEETVRRRYAAGLRNFFSLYQPLATRWEMVDNSDIAAPVVATGRAREVKQIYDSGLWELITGHER